MATFLSAMAMVGGFSIAYTSRTSITFALGVTNSILGSLLFLLFMTMMVIEIGVRLLLEQFIAARAPPGPPYRRLFVTHTWEPICRLVSRFFPRARAESIEIVDLERGQGTAPRYPWNSNGSPTIGRPYPHPRLEVTNTGLPLYSDRLDEPIRCAVALMRARQARAPAAAAEEGWEDEYGPGYLVHGY